MKKKTLFERLDDQEIDVEKEHHYYPYRATFNLKSSFDVSSLPESSSKVECLVRHELLSVNIASNGFLHYSDQSQIVDRFLVQLCKISEAVEENIFKNKYENAFEILGMKKERLDLIEETHGRINKKTRRDTMKQSNEINNLIGAFKAFVKELPVIHN